MDLFARQQAVRRRSWYLVLGFVLALLALMMASNLILLGVMLSSGAGLDGLGPLVALTSLATVVPIIGANVHRWLWLRRGGAAFALALGGSPVPPDTHEHRLRRLRELVEATAIAAGLSVPQVVMLEDEPHINAFAAGFAGPDAAIVLTRGALDRLDHHELEAVVAQAFTAIVQGDLRLDLRLVSLLFGISVLGVVGQQLVQGQANRHGAAHARRGWALLGFALWLPGALGQGLARGLRASVSRRRVLHLDAMAKPPMRDPESLIAAFLTITGSAGQGRLLSPGAEEISHMLFADGVGLPGWMATHPSLLGRIKALRPGFKTERFDDALARQHLPPPVPRDEDMAPQRDAPAALPSDAAHVAVLPAAVVDRLGRWRTHDLACARALMAALPCVLDRAARDRDEATPLLFACLLAPQPGPRQRQSFELKARMGERVLAQANDYAERLADLPITLRFPTAMLAAATLKRRPRQDIEAVADVCTALAHADARVPLFEYGLAQVLRSELDGAIAPAGRAPRSTRSLRALEVEIVSVLCALAHAAHASPLEAQRAFLAGLQHVLPRATSPYVPPTQGMAVLDEGWPRLDGLAPKAKVTLIEALVIAASSEGLMTIADTARLRVVCAILHAPLPISLGNAPP